ncbi:MAG: glycoside hydrolase family 3 N-terminal domain-containing protein [Betaproteobacteria bacterium]
MLSLALAGAAVAAEADPAALVRSLTLAEKVAQMQDAAPAVPRLGLPAYAWWNEGLHGLARTGQATVFPQAIGLAASWDAPLLQDVGRAIAAEARDNFARAGAAPVDGLSRNTARYRGLTIWSPNINIFRDPRWGRGQETYGEDPHLTARLGVAFIQGLQGPDPAHPTVIATPKHFAVHSGPERGRHGFDVAPSPHDLEDTYLPAFRAAVTEGHAGSIMCAYNAIGGTPACANADLLTTRLRGDWGFQGFVVTDCDAIEDMTLFHKTTASDVEASARALRAGTDLNCGRSYAALVQAVQRGDASEADVDRALRRLLEARARLGALGGPSEPVRPSAAQAARDRWLALQAARESMVLLKNDARGGVPALPRRAGARIAVVGPTADLLEDLEANYHGTASAPVTPLAGLRAAFGSDHVRYAQGAGLAANLALALADTALRTPDGRPGLRAEIFDSAALAGAPAVVRVDSKVNLDYHRVAPAPGLSSSRFAVRWSGQFVPPAAGDYTLGLRIERCFDCSRHDEVRLYVDGKLFAAAIDPHQDADVAALPLHVADTRPHSLRLELLHGGEDQGLTLQWHAPPRAQLAEALAATRGADAVVAFVGLSPNLEGEQLQVDVPGFDGGDRSSLDLPAAQQALLAALATALALTGTPLIVVLQSGSAVALAGAAGQADALLAAWYPGEAGGQAIAETLSGLNNPAGRLPVTFYRAASDLPPFDDYRMAGRTYRYFAGTPLWPFGHGLSYTRFGYGPPVLSHARLDAGEPLTIGVDIRNKGDRAGDEVVQAYLEPPASALAPKRALVAFRRLHLQAGESRHVEMVIAPRALSSVDALGTRAIEPGRYAVTVGGGQPGFAPTVRSEFTIAGRQELPK